MATRWTSLPTGSRPGDEVRVHRREPRARAGEARAANCSVAGSRVSWITVDTDKAARQDDRAADARRHSDHRAGTAHRRALLEVMTTHRSDRSGPPAPGRNDQAGRQSQRRRVPPPAAGARLSATRSATRSAACCCRRSAAAAVWAFRLDGVVHEHQTIPGRGRGRAPDHPAAEAAHAGARSRRRRSGPAHQARSRRPGVRPRHRVARRGHAWSTPISCCSRCRTTARSNGELYVNKGRGYVEAEQHPVDRTLPVDVVRIDSIYNPVRRANFTVAETRVGQRTDYDRLTVSVETNGTISPEDADRVRRGPRAGALPVLRRVRQGPDGRRRARRATAARQRPARGPAGPAASTTSACRCGRVNSLKNSNIRTLGDLVEFTPKTICSRSRTWARRRSAKSPTCSARRAELRDAVRRGGRRRCPGRWSPGTPPLAPATAR